MRGLNILSFVVEELVKLMVQHDIKLAEREKTLIENKLLSPTWEYST